MRFSANLGYLWADVPLPEAVRAAADAGFAAAECHWPYAEDAGAVRSALERCGLEMLALNTAKGDTFGRAALPDCGALARADVAQAGQYARRIGARAMHVLSGCAQGPEALHSFCGTLRAACDTGLTVLIEPINPVDVPGYFLGSFDLAEEVLERVNRPNLKVMLDCYHAGRMGLDPVVLLARFAGHIGHIQFASVPDRGPPDADMLAVLHRLRAAGWTAPFGAEYRPGGDTAGSLGWMRAAHASDERKCP